MRSARLYLFVLLFSFLFPLLSLQAEEILENPNWTLSESPMLLFNQTTNPLFGTTMCLEVESMSLPDLMNNALVEYSTLMNSVNQLTENWKESKTQVLLLQSTLEKFQEELINIQLLIERDQVLLEQDSRLLDQSIICIDSLEEQLNRQLQKLRVSKITSICSIVGFSLSSVLITSGIIKGNSSLIGWGLTTSAISSVGIFIVIKL